LPQKGLEGGQTDLIPPKDVIFFRDKLHPDAVFKLCRTGKGSDKPAVAYCALTEVRRLDLAFKELRLFARKPVELMRPDLQHQSHAHNVKRSSSRSRTAVFRTRAQIRQSF